MNQAGKWIRRWCLWLGAAVLIGAVGVSWRGRAEEELEQCRRIAADFLGVRAEGLSYEGIEAIPIGRQRVFRRASQKASVSVGCSTRQVTSCFWDWEPKRDQRPKLTPKELLAIAAAFLAAHRVAPFHDQPIATATSVEWRIAVNGIRTPFRQLLSVDPESKTVVGFSQWHQPIRVSLEPTITFPQAKEAALRSLSHAFKVREEDSTSGSLRLELCGRPVGVQKLVWSFILAGEFPENLEAPPPGYRWKPPTLSFLVDAHSGKVLECYGCPLVAERLDQEDDGDRH